MLTNDPYEYVLLFMDVIVHYVMLYMYAEKPNKFNNTIKYITSKPTWLM